MFGGSFFLFLGTEVSNGKSRAALGVEKSLRVFVVGHDETNKFHYSYLGLYFINPLKSILLIMSDFFREENYTMLEAYNS